MDALTNHLERQYYQGKQIIETSTAADLDALERVARRQESAAITQDAITRAVHARRGGVPPEEEAAAQRALWAALWAAVPAAQRQAYRTALDAHTAAQGQAERAAQALDAAQAASPATPAAVPAWSQRVGALTAEAQAYRQFAETASARYSDLRAQVNESLRTEAQKRAVAAVAAFDQERAAIKAEIAALQARKAAAGRVQRRAQVVSLAVRTGGVSAVPAVVLEGSPDEVPKKRR